MLKSASKTMRIDLIPGIAASPLDQSPQQIRIPKSDLSGLPFKPERGILGDDARVFFESVYDAGFITGKKGQVIENNSRALEFFQYRDMEFMELTVSDLISGADAELLETVLHNLESERFTLIQAYCIRSDQSSFPAEIVVSSIQNRPVRLCFFIRDITLRRRAEEMLRTEHAAIQNSAEGIVVTNTEGEIEYANPAVANLWKYDKPEALVGRTFGLLCRDASRGREILRHVMETGEAWRGEIEAVSTDQHTFFSGVSAVCNRNTDGDVVGTVLLLNDLTERRRAEEIQRESERQRVMLETLATACHHLGQPATILTSNLELLEMKLDHPDPDITKIIHGSMQACEQLAELLKRMRNVQVYSPTSYISSTEDSKKDDTRILKI